MAGTTDDDRASLEATLRALHGEAKYEDMLRVALEAYGDELGGYCGARLKDPDLAADAFAQTCEDLWRGLPTFRFGASFRTWAYAVARHAVARTARDPQRRAGRNVPLSQASVVERLEHELRRATTLWRKTDVKDGLRAIRDHLDDDDQELLVLRVDRGLSWLDLARVTGEPDDDDAALKKRAAALRKRFERVKDKVRALAQERGLLPEPDDAP